jgi:catalase (peroxidase I)
MFWLRNNLIGAYFLQALLGETHHNSPKTCKSDKQSILLQNFARATYKLKNKDVGVPSSYLSNCIRPGVVTLLSWPYAFSKVVVVDNSNKGILQDFLALTTMEHTGLVQWNLVYQ